MSELTQDALRSDLSTMAKHGRLVGYDVSAPIVPRPVQHKSRWQALKDKFKRQKPVERCWCCWETIDRERHRCPRCRVPLKLREGL